MNIRKIREGWRGYDSHKRLGFMEYRSKWGIVIRDKSHSHYQRIHAYPKNCESTHEKMLTAGTVEDAMKLCEKYARI